ncbi:MULTISPECIES: arginine--tRNA ligase [Gammaproteobacteria]|uniref:arginine--tRNA ligase n=1 Tax=Gammaproteobacteria TaxID=1236 RepID=UPI000DCFE1E6|nr:MULTISPECIES: arginine--tRNA ligase [Gammaproteobacteria]RTE85909.1 arginine--tRNA ligase [Aliidiomarina sp. B3213]TCZ90091.1 arginine--tRNA ligase [Lysobacter sp. N42]
MKEQIESLLAQALAHLKSNETLPADVEPRIQLDRPRDKSHGDFATNLALMLAKPAKQNPRALAEAIVAAIPENNLLSKCDIAGPGFINFTLDRAQLIGQLENAWQDSNLGVDVAEQGDTVVIDYSSPNLAKEMHVGHLRSTIIGDAVARVLELQGHKVVRQNHVGDWGTQFGMLLAHMEDEMQDQAEARLQLADLETFYKAAKKRFDEEEGFATRARNLVVKLQSGDPQCQELWQEFIHISLSHCQEVYDRLGVKLSQADVMAESAYNDDLAPVVADLTEKGLLVEDEGAKCVFLDEFKGKDGEPLPVIVQKKDGGYLYATTDLAAVRYRVGELHADRAIYVVDARQSLHFEQIFTVSRKAGYASDAVKLEHLGFGMVLGKDGRPYKSRDGGVTKLADLLNEAERRALELISEKDNDLSAAERYDVARVVGIASVKYADLSKNRTSDYMFDWDTMLSFEGNTAPYLLYANTRVKSVFQKAGVTMDSLQGEIQLPTEQDEALANVLVRFAETIQSVGQKGMPHFLCGYLFELAGAFSSFYEACPILNAEDEALKQSRLKLAALTQRTLEKGLELLGIETLERM